MAMHVQLQGAFDRLADACRQEHAAPISSASSMSSRVTGMGTIPARPYRPDG